MQSEARPLQYQYFPSEKGKLEYRQINRIDDIKNRYARPCQCSHNFRASVDFKKVKNMEQIKITGTALILDRINRIFAISGGLTMQWDFISDFKKIDDEPSLDEEGELFETAYDLVLEAKPKTKINLTSSYFAKEHKKDTDEIIKVFSFIEDNKRNIFETLGIRGVLE